MKLLTLSQKYDVTDEEHYRNMQNFINIFQNNPQGGFEYIHTFADGVYIREMRLKPHTLAIGTRHKKETVSIISKGTLRIFSRKGIDQFTAPKLVVSPAETQRLIYSLDEVVFITIHPTQFKTVEEVEDEWTYCGSEFLLEGSKNIQKDWMRENNERYKQLSSEHS